MDPYAWSWSSHALVLVPALTIAYFWALRRVPAPRWRIGCWLASMMLLLSPEESTSGIHSIRKEAGVFHPADENFRVFREIPMHGRGAGLGSPDDKEVRKHAYLYSN